MTFESPREERLLKYLARAEEAWQIALTICDRQARETWEHIADGWEQLAQQFARGLPPPSRKRQ